jgi:large subunit ribosomal protein L1
MGLVATKFGRILGPLGKMPNPKFGGVVAPGAELKPVVDKFRKTIRVTAKNEIIVKTKIAYEDMSDEQVIDNFNHVYEVITHTLPQGESNVKSVILKMTMGKPVMVGEKHTADVEEEQLMKEKKTSKEKPVEEKKETKK